LADFGEVEKLFPKLQGKGVKKLARESIRLSNEKDFFLHLASEVFKV